MDELCSMQDGDEKCVQNMLVGKPELKRPFKRSRHI
jgi:hypothetical protein